jgi:cytidine deaminase
MNNENEITHLAVNEPPCGYCRQFLNELSNANSLLIIIKDENNNIISKPLQDGFLPFSFGPKNLGNTTGMLDSPPFTFVSENPDKNDSLFQKTFTSLNKSYAPYTSVPSAIGLQFFDGFQISASYIENAAYNPSLNPMIGALNLTILFNKNFSEIEKIYFLEADITSDSQKNISSFPTTLQLLKSINFTNDFRFVLI